jgi:hypothetical protein
MSIFGAWRCLILCYVPASFFLMYFVLLGRTKGVRLSTKGARHLKCISFVKALIYLRLQISRDGVILLKDFLLHEIHKVGVDIEQAR